jgi:hypothetical protein
MTHYTIYLNAPVKNSLCHLSYPIAVKQVRQCAKTVSHYSECDEEEQCEKD